MFFIFLTHVLHLIQIECYLLFDQKTYFFKHLIDNIFIDI